MTMPARAARRAGGPPSAAWLVLAVSLAGCAARAPAGPPALPADAPSYVCADGTRIAVRFDQTSQATDLAIGGATRRLLPVPDPNGGVLYQDADIQLRRGDTDATLVLTDRSTTRQQACRRAP